jgi:hypothetical protein
MVFASVCALAVVSPSSPGPSAPSSFTLASALKKAKNEEGVKLRNYVEYFTKLPLLSL